MAADECGGGGGLEPENQKKMELTVRCFYWWGIVAKAFSGRKSEKVEGNTENTEGNPKNSQRQSSQGVGMGGMEDSRKKEKCKG